MLSLLLNLQHPCWVIIIAIHCGINFIQKSKFFSQEKEKKKSLFGPGTLSKCSCLWVFVICSVFIIEIWTSGHLHPLRSTPYVHTAGFHSCDFVLCVCHNVTDDSLVWPTEASSIDCASSGQWEVNTDNISFSLPTYMLTGSMSHYKYKWAFYC